MQKTFLIVLLFFIVSQSNYAQGKLEKAEKSLTSSSKKSRYNSSRSNSRNSNNSSDDHEIFVDLFLVFGEIMLYATYFSLIESPAEYEEKGSTASITKFPYFNSKKGNYAYDWGDDTTIFRTTITNRFIVENRKLYGNHFNVDLRFLKRIGAEVDYLQLWEENTNFGKNSLAFVTLLAKYHRIRTEKFNLYWALGASHIGGDIDLLGFTYGLGAELFFANPLSIETNFNQTLITTGTINKLNALLNYHTGRYKFSVGYEHLNIGNIDLSTYSAGIGVSF